MDSILASIKKMLNIDPDMDAFDTDIIIHINSALGILTQLGVGSNTGFSIKDNTSLWSDFIGDENNLEMVKTFIYMNVRLGFDPPSNAFVVDSITKQLEELKWRISVQADMNRTTE